jgi:acetyltransferase-like isoleucine patch superfamily enzyme
MIDGVLRAAYTSLRGRELPPETPTSVMAAIAVERARDLSRGTVRALQYGENGGLHLRGKRCVVRHPAGLFLGSKVIFSSDVVVEAYSRDGIRLGDRVTVARGASLLASGVVREPGVGITVGDDTAIGLHNVIWGQGGVTIGRDCLLAPHVLIVSENHTFDDPGLPVREQQGTRSAVSIGDDCWIGAGVKIMAGVTIGSRCVVGAGAVVTRDVPAGSIVVGIPARVVGRR